MIDRRLASLLCAALVGCSGAESTAQPAAKSTGAAYARAAAARGPEDPKVVWTPAAVVLQTRELAPGVFAVVPDDADAKVPNGVPVATSGGFIVGTKGVLAVETMINRNLAGQMLALIAEQTEKPLLYAVNTSYHGDHSYGNQFLPEATQVIQHTKSQAYIQSKFKDDIAFMTQNFGANAGLGELKPQKADIVLADGADRTIDLGGKTVRIVHLGFAQTEGDLFVYVPSAKVLFTGNPVLSGGPSFSWLLDGRVADATATLKKVRATFPADTIVVPGHGAPTTMKAVDNHIAYLEELQREVAAAKSKGLNAEQTAAAVDAAMKPKWGTYKIYDFIHTQVNVPKTFAEATAQ